MSDLASTVVCSVVVAILAPEYQREKVGEEASLTEPTSFSQL